MTKSILVSWVSFNHDPYERAKDGSYTDRSGTRTHGPTLDMLLNPVSPVRGDVQILYVLARRPPHPEPGGRAIHPREQEVVEALQQAVRELAPGVEVRPRWFEEDAAPTDHRAIFLFTARTLREIHRDHPRAEVVVNLSPGTPAMHAALLLSLQARLAGEKVRAFQGTPPDRRKTPEDAIREVPCNLLAELSKALPPDPDSLGRGGAWTIDQARSPQLKEVSSLVKRFGAVPFPVLILGSRGTGKTVVARKLRDQYREWTVRAAEPAWNFHLNCAEFGGADPNILRSALFGHAKNAFSNAGEAREGVLESAADDCVFLDEIHRMDRQAQGMLLLALQRKGTFRRLGGDKAIAARFRLLAATNVPLVELRDHLNDDFLDRISDLAIRLPDLHECPADLGEIWGSVVRSACEELCARDKTRAGVGAVEQLVNEFLPHRAMIERELTSFRLPGNFRDLEKLARRLLVAGLANDPIAPSIQKAHVVEELDRLRHDEKAIDTSLRVAGSLDEELPTKARCEAYLRAARDADANVDGSALVELWEQRLLDAAATVGGSGAKGAALLDMNPRTFNEKRKSKRSDPIA
ncbi:MAG: sigma 54-interacting transcriptional regulator [Kofleriaceae bacterium]